MRETETSPPYTVAELLEKYNIQEYTLDVSNVQIEFLNDHVSPLSVKKVLCLPREELLQVPLKILQQEEKLLTGQKGPRGRSGKVIAQIKNQAGSRRGRLLNEGPGEVLASIVLNSGRKARWIASGLAGAEDSWLKPDRSEIEFWKWFYNQYHSVPPNATNLFYGERINILHAAFVIRLKQDDIATRSLEFMGEIEPFSDRELDFELAKVTKHFSPTSKKR